MRKPLIQELIDILERIPEIQAAVLIGSYGRNKQTPLSDVALQLIVKETFNDKNFHKFVADKLQKGAAISFFLRDSRKTLLYIGEDFFRIELIHCTNFEDIDRLFIGSGIQDIDHSLLFDKTGNLEKYLQRLIERESKHKPTAAEAVDTLIKEFIYFYEKSSSTEAKNDAYKFYFEYNIALQKVVKLRYYAAGQDDITFVPLQFHRHLIRHENQHEFFDLGGVLYLEEANRQKRRLLDFFYETLDMLENHLHLPILKDRIKQFCENIYTRDYLWNFRDAAKYNSNMRRKMIFRSSSPTNYQDVKKFRDKLSELNITQIIDLRGPKEIADHPYRKEFISQFKYVNVPIEPRERIDLSRPEYQTGTLYEKAYRFFVLECQSEVKTVLEAIAHNMPNASLIHCLAGKDRTGFILTLLHLLVEPEKEVLYTDYLASAADTSPEKLDSALQMLSQYKNIDDFLLHCGIASETIATLRKFLRAF